VLVDVDEDDDSLGVVLVVEVDGGEAASELAFVLDPESRLSVR
jgi:hypothetical protein